MVEMRGIYPRTKKHATGMFFAHCGAPCCSLLSLHTRTKTPPPGDGGGVFVLVEMRGIEPLSENHLPWLSTSVAAELIFPLHSARQQALRIGSLKFMTGYKALSGSRAPLIDALIRTAVLPARTAAAI